MTDGPSVPTQYGELNDVLAELVERAQGILGASFVGAYLQGSFAIGDADMESDCDFLIVVSQPLDPAQEAQLRALHAEFPSRPQHWARHLEGSYPLASELKTLNNLDARWLYVDHGASVMEWSAHCNTEVSRWSLRERGVRLAGPEPKVLVDVVPPEVLRARMRAELPSVLADILSWVNLEVAWSQRYLVATVCRMLYTERYGEVVSKRAALRWGVDALDPRWRSLLRQVDADRGHPYDPTEHPRPGSIEAAIAFATEVTRDALPPTDG